MKFKNDIDLDGNEILNLAIENLGTPPTPYPGRLYYNTNNNTMYYYSGTSWAIS